MSFLNSRVILLFLFCFLIFRAQSVTFDPEEVLIPGDKIRSLYSNFLNSKAPVRVDVFWHTLNGAEEIIHDWYVKINMESITKQDIQENCHVKKLMSAAIKKKENGEMRLAVIASVTDDLLAQSESNFTDTSVIMNVEQLKQYGFLR